MAEVSLNNLRSSAIPVRTDAAPLENAAPTAFIASYSIATTGSRSSEVRSLTAQAQQALRSGQVQEAGRLLYKASRQLGDVGRLPLPMQMALLQHHPLWHQDARGRALCLARPAERHRGFLAETLADPEFRHQYNAYLEPGPAAAEAYIQRARQPSTQVQQVNWVIESRDGTPHGLATIAKLNLVQRTGELIVGFRPAHRSARRTAEAYMLILSVAFRDLRLRKLNSVVYADNPVSQDLTIRSGFTQEGYLREQLILPGQDKPVDLYLNGLLAKDYFSNSLISRVHPRLMPGVDLNHLYDLAPQEGQAS